MLLTGLLLSGLIAAVAWRVRALTVGGAVAGTLIGAAIYGFGGVSWAVLLLVFFATSSALTRAGREQKPVADGMGRTASQVLANGVVATAFAVAHLSGGVTTWIAAGFAGAVAAATADTWATEIGLLSRTPPRLITTGQICAPGQSGGITSLGTRGGIAGAGVIAVLGNLLIGASFISVLLAGVVAMFVDSLIGVTLEGRWRLVTNDTVNLLTTMTGGLLAGALGAWLP